MTLEHRMVVGLGDIRAVTLECKKCGARLTLSPEKLTERSLNQCPMCRDIWLEPTHVSTTTHASEFLRFLLLLGDAQKAQQKGSDSEARVRVLLELDVPPSSQPPFPPAPPLRP
jgi:hypothetical protein